MPGPDQFLSTARHDHLEPKSAARFRQIRILEPRERRIDHIFVDAFEGIPLARDQIV